MITGTIEEAETHPARRNMLSRPLTSHDPIPSPKASAPSRSRPRSASWRLTPRVKTDYSPQTHIHLLPQGSLIRTGPVDHADWNYKPLLGWIQQQRFRLALSLLPTNRAPRVLEIGYGSGIFLPELSQHCQELYGIDIHGRNEEIAGKLLEQGVTAQLHRAPAEAIPFDNESFDAAVAVSSLEFVQNVPAACSEIARVLKRNGSLIVITPGHSFVADLALRILTGESAKRDFGNRRQSLMRQVQQCFRVSERRLFPTMAAHMICLYKGYRLQPTRPSSQ